MTDGEPGEFYPDEGDTLDRTVLKERIARNRAKDNVEEWGQQPPAELVLAAAEELGEMAAWFDCHYDPETGRGDPLAGLLSELASFGDAVRTRLEDRYEDGGGEPLPPGERPAVGARVKDTEEFREELYDLMALCYQIDYAIYQGERGGSGD